MLGRTALNAERLYFTEHRSLTQIRGIDDQSLLLVCAQEALESNGVESET